MAAISLDVWVKTRVKAIRETRALKSKTALKMLLIAECQDKALEIRQIINKMDFTPSGPPALVAMPKDPAENGCKQDAVGRDTTSGTSNGSAQKLAVKHQKIEVGPSTVKHEAAKGDSKLQGLRNSVPDMVEQFALLPQLSSDASKHVETNMEELKNAVLCSPSIIKGSNKAIPQYSLLGCRKSSLPNNASVGEDFRIFLNTNIPFSAFVCGLQGSGKSHTVSCMIENCLIPSPILGVLQRPLKALAFHYAEHTSPSAFRPSELAYIAKIAPEFHKEGKAPSVVVLVSPSSYPTLKALYANLPGVSVHPFLIKPNTLTVATMLALMAVDQGTSPPLYISQVKNILRQMSSTSSGGFNYQDFRRRLRDTNFKPDQRDYLNQRLDLLESFLDLSGKSAPLAFRPGELTVIDLSCPFMDDNTACILFRIAMTMFLESDSSSGGKVIVVDEAHKYMRDTPAARDLSESLLSTIREQRHYGARVIISTQEPTISPKLIDLCSLTVIHRFSSPSWFQVLKQHIVVGEAEGDTSALFAKITALRTGEALVFAPTAALGSSVVGKVGLGGEVMHVGVRRRITWDGGRSVVCV